MPRTEEPPTLRTTVRGKGQVTIPQAIREAARLIEGDPVDVQLTPEGILLRPKKVVDASQLWYWSSDWQKGERDADEELAAGEGEVFEDGAAFLASLDR